MAAQGFGAHYGDAERTSFPKPNPKLPRGLPIMKHSNHHHTAHSAAPALMPVRFEFTHPTAITVCVAGTFNDWHPTAKAMNSSGVGNWWKETDLAPGTYEYCLVVDGEWMADPLARDYVPNPFGGRNSVLIVACSQEAAHRDDAINLPLKNTNKPKPQKR
jgi:1,4-alpha-glucan branching enzyme